MNFKKECLKPIEHQLNMVQHFLNVQDKNTYII